MSKYCKEKYNTIEIDGLSFFVPTEGVPGYSFQGGVRCLQFDDEKIISGSWDMTIMVCII